ncbi:MAG: translation initiation factor IF-2 [Clostridia bacterium]|nr:translation initiation factor IF-2 [Clostridia bacterium]
MASNFFDTAKSVKTGAEALLDRLKSDRETLAQLLASAKAAENRLIEKEQREKREQAEKEKAERLKKFLESGESNAYVVDAADQASEAAAKDAPEPPAEPVKAEAPAVEPAPAAAAEQPAPKAEIPATPVQKAASPAQKPAYVATPTDRPRRDNGPRPQEQRPGQDRRPGDNRSQGSFGDRPRRDGAAPRADRPQRPQSGSRAVIINPSAGSRDQNRNRNNNNNYDKDKKAKNKKAMQKENGPDLVWDEDGSMGNRRKGKNSKQEVVKPAPVVIDHAVITSETITVKELSEKIGKPAAEIIKKLFLLGIMATINQDIDFDTCELIASDYNITLEQQIAKSYEDVLADNAQEEDREDQLQPRPPVVTIMGHVDHGKTSLLDAFRHSNVTAGEAGGITQHIGAYTVMCKGRQITFIDTPGHEAFTSMRARGAQVTDIVILVVAADDGIMPQTIEAINHAKAANVPIVVAVNKIDKPGADPDKVTQQLTEYGLVSEDWGGDTIVVPVSAKKNINLDTLLEMVLLQADVLELRANPNRLAKGTVIEAKLDKARGPLATVLVQNGTLKKGDTIIAGTAYGRIRAMIDDKGRTVNTAGPSTPVEILGFNEVPEAGDVMNVADADKLTRQVAEERKDKIKAAQIKAMQKVSLDELFNQMAEGDLKELNIIVKADVQGSAEAVKQSLEKLSNDEVRVRCIHNAVGAITESDVMFASASNAIVIGFNVRPDGAARATAEKEKVDIRTYRVIYNAIEDVEAAMKGMFKPVFKEVEMGRISVRNTFKISGVGTIAGAYVQDGKVTRSAQVRVVRDGVVVYDGKISSLKRFKDDVKEVAAGYECGISFENFNDIHEGDVIEAYTMEQVER